MSECPLYPPQDLARLVLGYLEEEECTSAYNEFIKSSPHLDVFRTNYDNAVMLNFSSKSLKDVFGEYCAFKAYTRNCKIPGLRTRLLQCKTLLDTAQLLIANIDVKKIHNQDDGYSRQSSNFSVLGQPTKRKQCEVCKTSDSMDGCECRLRPSAVPNLFAPPFKMVPQATEAFSNLPLQTLVETTQLADLPGTSNVAKRKSIIDNEVQQKSVAVARTPEMETCATDIEGGEQVELTRKCMASAAPSNLTLSAKTNDLMDCSEDFNEILNLVSPGSTSANTDTTNQITPVVDRNSVPENKRRVSAVDRSFQDFAASVSSGNSKFVLSEAIPDSSTPESNTAQTVAPSKGYDAGLVKIAAKQPRNSNPNQVNTSRLKYERTGQNIDQPASQTSNSQEQISSETDGSRDSSVTSGNDNSGYREKATGTNQKLVSSSSAKNTSSKVTILSNNILKTAGDDGTIILNKCGTTTMLRPLPGKPPGVLNFNPLPAANSIIHINGLPAYQAQASKFANPIECVYTKEEIMAMPTVFVLQSPATSNPSQPSSCSGTNNFTNSVPNTNSCVMQTDSGFRSLEPISVDVEPFPEITAQIPTKEVILNGPAAKDSNFVPNGTIPKETVSLEKVACTPKNPLLVKKASSTPRRNSSSHVRVLDFTTPRRILPTQELPEDNVVSTQANTTVSHITKDNLAPECTAKPHEISIVKRTEIARKSKADWDADLRALLPTCPEQPKLPKNKLKKNEKTKSTKVYKENKDSENKDKPKVRSRKKPDKAKKKKSIEVEEKEEVSIKPSVIPVKPTINLIKDWRDHPSAISVKVDEGIEAAIPVDTPENDARPTMEHPTSTTKHNLSDLFLLQTPYKMMMDNIHMETPRYIDPSVFDGPISDIKIDSIPTPNFTPNFLMSGGKGMGGMAATPSSYSSRPTDYSSGGSYYRPDEHDYAPLPDLQPASQSHITMSPVPSTSNDTSKTPKSKILREANNTVTKSSRPRRQCTLKVSYCETPVSKSGKESTKAHNRESQSSTVSNDSTVSTQFSDTSKTSSVTEDPRPSVDISESKEEFLSELEKKRKRTIANLKKKTPVKTKKRRSGSSFPKVKITEKKINSTKKTKTVADLRQSIGPRKMANISKDKFGKKSICKDHSVTPPSTVVPKKSRRKSSTPRKVDKNIVVHLDDSASVDTVSHKQDVYMTEDELPPLRVSDDDGSQDTHTRKNFINEDMETDDIGQIKAYIETTSHTMEPTVQELVQRGFDLETAKSIERDLLGSPQRLSSENIQNNLKETGKIIVDVREEIVTGSEIVVTIERSPNQDSEGSSKSKLQCTVDPASSEEMNSKINSNNVSTSLENTSIKNDSAIILEGDIVMVRQTFDENSDNHFTYVYNEDQAYTADCNRIDENFALNIQCDDLNIKVCLGKQEILYDLAPKTDTENANDVHVVLDTSQSSSSSSDSDEVEESVTETVNAVKSISNIEPLYTPIKSDQHTSLQRQCLEIFDSTLNSLDTPIKTSFSKSSEVLTPCYDEDQHQEGWIINSKRKNPSSSPVEESASKKNKPDHQILMQNIDIESLLTKLHGENT